MATIGLDEKSYELITKWRYEFGTDRKKTLEDVVNFVASHQEQFSEFRARYAPSEARAKTTHNIMLKESTHRIIEKCSRTYSAPLKIITIQMVAFVETNIDELKKNSDHNRVLPKTG